jgi:hypothetical protein
MAKNLGPQSDKTMNREVRSQWNPNDTRQFSCVDAPAGENYYTVRYDQNGNEIPESGVFNPEGDF